MCQEGLKEVDERLTGIAGQIYTAVAIAVEDPSDVHMVLLIAVCFNAARNSKADHPKAAVRERIVEDFDVLFNQLWELEEPIRREMTVQ